jgi:hypothetical protein
MVDARWFLDRLPSPDELADLLGNDPVAALLEVANTRAPIELGFTPPNDLAMDPAVAALFALATKTVAKLHASSTVLLTPEEEQSLHAFVHLVARPALRVFEGDVPSPPANWRPVEQNRPVIRHRLPGVGRLDTAQRNPCGTGWFIAQNLIITNNHVVAALCGVDVHHDPSWRKKLDALAPTHSALWEQTPAARPVWDPRDSPPEGAGAVGAVRKIRALHSQFDAALLEVEGVPNSGQLALPITTVGPGPSGLEVYLAGYPAPFVGTTHPAVLKLLFGGPSKAVPKRLSPGRILGAEAKEHDASTLGGSSGSPVVAFSDHLVRALHYSGRYAEANFAVPFWRLRKDPFLTDAGIKAE